MPRKPTAHARYARSEIVGMLDRHPSGEPLPTLRDLGERYLLHPSTIFRLLRDMETEGFVWQGPSGRFYTPEARRERLRGAPVCFIGREMWQWSQLYMEILQGVSEVCSANNSPLILHSAPKLVQLPEVDGIPVFATTAEQKRELVKLIEMIPSQSIGFLLDHLWSSDALEGVAFPTGMALQLLHGTGEAAEVVHQDLASAAQITFDYLKTKSFDSITLVEPFSGDPAIDEALEYLTAALEPLSPERVAFADRTKLNRVIAKKHGRHCIVFPEDGTADTVARMVAAKFSHEIHPHIEIMGTQGTGVLKSPHTRLRFDYRRLGRAAASRIIHGTPIKSTRPFLITGAGDEVFEAVS